MCSIFVFDFQRCPISQNLTSVHAPFTVKTDSLVMTANNVVPAHYTKDEAFVPGPIITLMTDVSKRLEDSLLREENDRVAVMKRTAKKFLMENVSAITNDKELKINAIIASALVPLHANKFAKEEAEKMMTKAVVFLGVRKIFFSCV